MYRFLGSPASCIVTVADDLVSDGSNGTTVEVGFDDDDWFAFSDNGSEVDKCCRTGFEIGVEIGVSDNTSSVFELEEDGNGLEGATFSDDYGRTFGGKASF